MTRQAAIAILSLILMVLALLILWLERMKQEREREFQDTEQLRDALFNWEPFVLEREGTMRGVKRFANRVRFLSPIDDDESEDKTSLDIDTLVGFVALEEISCIDSSATELTFKQFKNVVLEQLNDAEYGDNFGDGIKEWLDKVTEDDWQNYQNVVMGY